MIRSHDLRRMWHNRQASSGSHAVRTIWLRGNGSSQIGGSVGLDDVDALGHL